MLSLLARFLPSRHGRRKLNGYAGPHLHKSTLSLTQPQLTDAERSRLLARLERDSDAGEKEKFDWKYVRQAFLDPLVWGYALLFHGFAFVLYTLSLFMVRFRHAMSLSYIT